MKLITPYNLACKTGIDQGLITETIGLLKLKPVVVAKTTCDFDYPGYSEQQARSIIQLIKTGRKIKVPKQPKYIDTREVTLRTDYSSTSYVLDIARKLKIKLAELRIGSNVRYYWTEQQAKQVIKHISNRTKYSRKTGR